MRVFVTGHTGFVGRHVWRQLELTGHQPTVEQSGADAVIHLAWAGLPNYESTDHYQNVGWQSELLHGLARDGLTNLTVTGTCLETVPNPPHYAMAKLQLREALRDIPTLKWVRLWYLYGPGQRPDCLLPALQRAVAAGKQEFHVADAARDFIPVETVASHLCRIATQTKSVGTFDCCSGVATPIRDFCRMFAPEMHFIADYPTASYEPKSFHGNPSRLLSI